jgi:hypothetical protein
MGAILYSDINPQMTDRVGGGSVEGFVPNPLGYYFNLLLIQQWEEIFIHSE